MYLLEPKPTRTERVYFMLLRLTRLALQWDKILFQQHHRCLRDPELLAEMEDTIPEPPPVAKRESTTPELPLVPRKEATASRPPPMAEKEANAPEPPPEA